jgi:hypothetical protein
MARIMAGVNATMGQAERVTASTLLQAVGLKELMTRVQRGAECIGR